MKVDRITLCSSLNHESLFDLDYKNSYDTAEPSIFFKLLSESGSCLPPAIIAKEYLFCHSVSDEILLLLICDAKSQVTATQKISLMQFSYKLLKICKDFLGKLTVDNVLSNVTLLAEIVDCMLIGGYIHLTDTDKIRGFLTQNYTESQSPVRITQSQQALTAPLKQLSGTGYQPTHQEKVVKVTQSTSSPTKDDIYIDLIETLDYKLNTTGETTCNISGALNSSNVSGGRKQVNFQFKKGYSKLVGQHKYDQCVRSNELVTHGLLSADVPLGQTQLMSYQLSTTNLPFSIDATKSHSDRDEVHITLNCNVPAAVICLKVRVIFSFQHQLSSVLKQSLMPSQSLAVSESDTRCVEWSIPEIAGQTYSKTRFKVIPASRNTNIDISYPICSVLQFEISNYLHSACKLQSVKIDRAPNVKKWIRHVTVSGDCKLQVG